MNSSLKNFSSIHLRGIELDLHLGWSESERLKKQIVKLDVMLRFATPPLACSTDDLADTYCYDTLIQAMINETESREFRLIEHLASYLYDLIRKSIPEIAAIQVSISKNPQFYIPKLTSGVVFTYGDDLS